MLSQKQLRKKEKLLIKMPRPDKPNWSTMHVNMIFIINEMVLVLPTSVDYLPLVPHVGKPILTTYLSNAFAKIQ